MQTDQTTMFSFLKSLAQTTLLGANCQYKADHASKLEMDKPMAAARAHLASERQDLRS